MRAPTSAALWFQTRFTTVTQNTDIDSLPTIHSDVGHVEVPNGHTTMCGLGLEHTRNFMKYTRSMPCSACMRAVHFLNTQLPD